MKTKSLKILLLSLLFILFQFSLKAQLAEKIELTKDNQLLG